MSRIIFMCNYSLHKPFLPPLNPIYRFNHYCAFRIDIHVNVPSVPYKELSGDYSGERSEILRHRVSEARDRQLKRFKDDKLFANGQMKTRHIKKYCALSGEAHSLIDTAMQRLGLSARAYSRILKVARTVADLDGADSIGGSHVSEAIQYRMLDRGQI